MPKVTNQLSDNRYRPYPSGPINRRNLEIYVSRLFEMSIKGSAMMELIKYRFIYTLLELSNQYEVAQPNIKFLPPDYFSLRRNLPAAESRFIMKYLTYTWVHSPTLSYKFIAFPYADILIRSRKSDIKKAVAIIASEFKNVAEDIYIEDATIKDLPYHIRNFILAISKRDMGQISAHYREDDLYVSEQQFVKSLFYYKSDPEKKAYTVATFHICEHHGKVLNARLTDYTSFKKVLEKHKASYPTAFKYMTQLSVDDIRKWVTTLPKTIVKRALADIVNIYTDLPHLVLNCKWGLVNNLNVYPKYGGWLHLTNSIINGMKKFITIPPKVVADSPVKDTPNPPANSQQTNNAPPRKFVIKRLYGISFNIKWMQLHTHDQGMLTQIFKPKRVDICNSDVDVLPNMWIKKVTLNADTIAQSPFVKKLDIKQGQSFSGTQFPSVETIDIHADLLENCIDKISSFPKLRTLRVNCVSDYGVLRSLNQLANKENINLIIRGILPTTTTVVGDMEHDEDDDVELNEIYHPNLSRINHFTRDIVEGWKSAKMKIYGDDDSWYDSYKTCLREFTDAIVQIFPSVEWEDPKCYEYDIIFKF